MAQQNAFYATKPDDLEKPGIPPTVGHHLETTQSRQVLHWKMAFPSISPVVVVDLVLGCALLLRLYLHFPTSCAEFSKPQFQGMKKKDDISIMMIKLMMMRTISSSSSSSTTKTPTPPTKKTNQTLSKLKQTTNKRIPQTPCKGRREAGSSL